MDPLRLLADHRNVLVGAAVCADALARDERYRAALGREINVCVGENAFKWGATHPEQGRYDFAAADRVAAFAQQHRIALRGHCLAWHHANPAWLSERTTTRDEAVATLRDHIHTVAGRYRGSIIAWDVVNEAIDDKTFRWREDAIWQRAIGPDYIALAFQFAREADPHAKLYYNDYDACDLGPKSNAVYELVQRLQSEGVPIDGVGWQCHVTEGFRVNDQHRANAERVAALGLELSVTELDVRLRMPPSPEAYLSQAESVRGIVRLGLAQPRFGALLFWGLSDKHSWVPSFFEGYGDALPLDAEYLPKPAYHAIADELAGGPS
jgi:endo-1,4-beta-xylanase